MKRAGLGGTVSPAGLGSRRVHVGKVLKKRGETSCFLQEVAKSTKTMCFLCFRIPSIRKPCKKTAVVCNMLLGTLRNRCFSLCF